MFFFGLFFNVDYGVVGRVGLEGWGERKQI